MARRTCLSVGRAEQPQALRTPSTVMGAVISTGCALAVVDVYTGCWGPCTMLDEYIMNTYLGARTGRAACAGCAAHRLRHVRQT